MSQKSSQDVEQLSKSPEIVSKKDNGREAHVPLKEAKLKRPPDDVDSRTASSISLDDPSLFINRELSWLQFNHHVLEEALDQRLPLLERVKFLAIFASNLDEFFMIRVSGLRRQLAAGVLEAPPDGMTPSEQLAAIRKLLLPELANAYQLWLEDLRLSLEDSGVRVLHYEDMKGKLRKIMRDYFEQEIMPILTPLAFDPAHPFPRISNLSLNLAVVIHDPQQGEKFARLKDSQFIPPLTANSEGRFCRELSSPWSGESSLKSICVD